VQLDIVRRPAAADDLREIWWYSFETWGFEKAESYAADLERAIEALAQPQGRLLMRRFRKHIYRLRVKSHYLFVEITGGQAILLRVLHGRADAGQHLG